MQHLPQGFVCPVYASKLTTWKVLMPNETPTWPEMDDPSQADA